MYRLFDRFMEQAGNRATSGARARLVAEARKAANTYRAGAGEAAALGVIQDVQWEQYLNLVWREVVTSAGGLMLQAMQVPADSGALDRTARLYLARNGATRGAGIANTSRNHVADSIADGLAEHETTAEVARRIAADAETRASWRGATIGSTESHAAGYLGAWSAALQSLRRWDKVWTAPRARGVTCDQHKSTHGQRRGLRDAFDVANDYEPDGGSDRMNYPGDGEIGARPSNVINCRCAMEFERP